MTTCEEKQFNEDDAHASMQLCDVAIYINVCVGGGGTCAYKIIHATSTTQNKQIRLIEKLAKKKDTVIRYKSLLRVGVDVFSFLTTSMSMPSSMQLTGKERKWDREKEKTAGLSVFCPIIRC